MSRFHKISYITAALMILGTASETLANPDIGSLYPTLATHSLELRPVTSYQLARAVFLPDTKDDLGFSGRDTGSGNFGQGDACKGYTLSSCPANATCTPCPTNSNKKKLTGCKSGYTLSGNTCVAATCSALNSSYKTSVPNNSFCTKISANGLTCYKDCKTVSCSGYNVSCPSGMTANSLSVNGITYQACSECPVVQSSSFTKYNCTPKCKISQCPDKQKLNDAGTACVAKDDNCPNGYYKSCETGTQGDPQYTEAGTACYQCKAKPSSTPSFGDILYSDLTTGKPENHASSGKTAIGIVVDIQNKLAMALTKSPTTMQWAYGDGAYKHNPYLVTCSDPLNCNTISGRTATDKILTFGRENNYSFPAAEYADSYATPGTKSGDWHLPSIQEIQPVIYTMATSYLRIVNDSLSVAGGEAFAENYDAYWTSDESQANGAYMLLGTAKWKEPWTATSTWKSRWFNHGKYEYAYIRPFIYYADINNDTCPILYSDLTTSKEIISGKTPIGVVFDEEKKLAIALTENITSWATEELDVYNLENLTQKQAEASWSGKENTKKIVAYCEPMSTKCPAAEYSFDFVTEGTNSGDWYLPALGELKAIYAKKEALNTQLSQLKGTIITPVAYYSSSEDTGRYAWGQNLGDGSIRWLGKDGRANVRPVINYGNILTGMDLMCTQLSYNPEARFCGGIDPYAGNQGNYPQCFDGNGRFTDYAGTLNNGHTCWSCDTPGETLRCHTNSPAIEGCSIYQNGKCASCSRGTLTADGNCK